MKKENKMKDIINIAMDCLGIAVTIIDTKGTILYYNHHAKKVLDRKPEYIGKDVYSFHKKAPSIETIKSMIQDFKDGRIEPFHYEAKPYGYPISVTVSPMHENGKFIGCVQSVILPDRST